MFQFRFGSIESACGFSEQIEYAMFQFRFGSIERIVRYYPLEAET